MPELLAGQAATVRGTTAIYHLQNVGGVLSCTCPAWRNQSLPIACLTCKHLRAYRGDAAAAARRGGALPAQATARSVPRMLPPLLLAATWDEQADPTGWLVSEKLDGVRAWWDGKQFLSRQGQRYRAPSWFMAGLPLVPLDGELWRGRGQFQATVSIVRRADGGDAWRSLRFVSFDAPGEAGPFTARLAQVRLIMAECRPPYAIAHPHVPCSGRHHLRTELARVLALGGEGLILRQPDAAYIMGRSATLLKVKGSQETEARVLGYEPGRGRHRGRVGALVAALPDGTRFQVGSGLSDRDRASPPPVGAIITVRYQERTTGGGPRCPVFVRLRPDLTALTSTTNELPMATPAPVVQRFAYIGGPSAKFWEVACDGPCVTVRFGRLGTTGQEQAKTLADAAAAQKHVGHLIRQKQAKGYVAVT